MLDTYLLDNSFSKPEKAILKSLKVEALISGELYDAALALSNDLMSDGLLPQKYYIRLLLNRSLLYEILEIFPKSEAELDKVQKLYSDKKTEKDANYAVYLYRLSSLNRVMKKESLAKVYAIKSAQFAKENNFADAAAIANMLLGFLEDSTKTSIRLNYFNLALQNFKSHGDRHGQSGIYYSIAKVEIQNGNFLRGNIYLDSVINTASKQDHFYIIGKAYEKKSEIASQLQQKDSALAYFKRYTLNDKKSNLQKQEINISELDYQYELKKDQIQQNAVYSDLKNANRYNYSLLIF